MAGAGDKVKDRIKGPISVKESYQKAADINPFPRIE